MPGVQPCSTALGCAHSCCVQTPARSLSARRARRQPRRAVGSSRGARGRKVGAGSYLRAPPSSGAAATGAAAASAARPPASARAPSLHTLSERGPPLESREPRSLPDPHGRSERLQWPPASFRQTNRRGAQRDVISRWGETGSQAPLAGWAPGRAASGRSGDLGPLVEARAPARGAGSAEQRRLAQNAVTGRTCSAKPQGPHTLPSPLKSTGVERGALSSRSEAGLPFQVAPP